MLLRNALPLAALSVLLACRLAADPIDPFSGSDFGDPAPGLDLAALGPICFPEGGNTDCLNDLVLAGSTTDGYNGPDGFELDSVAGLLSADFSVNGLDEGEWVVPYDATTIDDRTSGSTYGPEFSDISAFDTVGPGSGLPDLELRMDTGKENPGGSTTINPTTGGYNISSFFDIFTDLSIDGGNTWTPTNVSPQTELDLSVAAPEPGSAALLLAAMICVVALPRRRQPKVQ